MKNKKSFIARLIDGLFNALKAAFTRKNIMSWLKENAVKMVLKRLLIVSGWQALIVAYIVEEFFEEIAIPLLNLGIRKGKFAFRVKRGKVQVLTMKKVKEDGDEEAYNTLIDDA